MRTARRRLLALGILAVLAALPAVALAGRAWTVHSVFVNRAPVEDGSGTRSARLTQILLPNSFAVKQRSTYLAFGPVGACRSTGSVRVVLVRSDAADAASVLDEQLPSGTPSYGSGARSDAVWRIVKAGTGGGDLRGAYVRPTRIADTWVVVRVATTAHGSCHTGGYRESVAHPLADALATTRASGY